MSFPGWAARLPWNVLAEAATAGKVPLPLLAAIAMQESAGEVWASRYEPKWSYFMTPEVFAKKLGVTLETERVHQATSWGLFQVMGSVLRELGFQDHLPKACKPHLNATFAALKLNSLLGKYRDPKDAIAAYNAGSPRRNPNGKYVNQDYVDRVEKFMSEV